MIDFARRGSFHHVFGHRVFTLHERPKDPLGTLLFLHGFPSSSRDFHLTLPRFAERYEVIAHDHVGFGLSDKPEHFTYSLVDQADVALGLWRALGVTKGHLIAHDYGTSVATELLARRARDLLPITVESVTFSNGSVHFELAELTPSQRLLKSPLGPVFSRIASKRVFVAQLRRILGDPNSISTEELDAMFEGMVHGHGRARLPALAGYMDERARMRARWIGPLASLDVPVHVLWGRRDPVAVPAIAERLAAEIPGASLTWLDALGHYPMLEAPNVWADAALAFLDDAT